MTRKQAYKTLIPDWEVGDTVRVTRADHDYENGWDNGWASSMNELIGRKFKIASLDSGGGFALEGQYWLLPWFVLEHIESSPKEKKEKKVKMGDTDWVSEPFNEPVEILSDGAAGEYNVVFMSKGAVDFCDNKGFFSGVKKIKPKKSGPSRDKTAAYRFLDPKFPNGARVKMCRRVATHESGSPFQWVEEMNRYVGREFIVKGRSVTGHGYVLQEATGLECSVPWAFPWTALELIDIPKEEIKNGDTDWVRLGMGPVTILTTERPDRAARPNRVVYMNKNGCVGFCDINGFRNSKQILTKYIKK